MKLAGCLLLLSGALIVVASFAELTAFLPRLAFTLAGITVELLGLSILARTHLLAEKSRARSGSAHIRSQLL